MKVKTKGQGLEIDFEVQENTGVEVYHDIKKIKSDKTPHPDLTAILRVFRGHVAEVFYFAQFRELISSNVFLPNEEQVKILRAKYEDLESKITVTGIGVSGKEDNRGLIILAKLKTETGHEVAINTQRIKFDGTKYGFEEDLETLVVDLESEVYEYVVNNKQAQLEMGFDDDVDFKSKAANDGQMDLIEEALQEQE